jgi:succinate dehydrogenase/fumarate reductase flavoprotein subunit
MQSIAETNLVVVGGGPAGAAAAITARPYGLRVILLERRRCEGPARNPMIASDASGWTWMARMRPNIYQWYACRYRELGRPPAGVPLNLTVFGRWDSDAVST